ncbi:hypothetical protein Ciccas_010244 [Cichlidogyrus casuarinus]|uniref:Tyrosine-protein kinase n=1 Tax=Cichlidogyrus casuarinus TaxID=1844966 RepID=A0ABD2PUM9_9PLAT
MGNSYSKTTIQTTPDGRRFVRFRAIHSYEPINKSNQLRYKVGAIFMVDESTVNSPWVNAVKVKSRKEGLVWKNYLVRDDNSAKSHPAWLEIDRAEASRRLCASELKSGTFILRPSSRKNRQALTILDQNNKNKPVWHYRIAKDTQTGHIKLLGVGKDATSFETVHQLVDHYRRYNRGIVCLLTDAFPKDLNPPTTFEQLEVDRNSIKLLTLIGKGNFGEVHLAIMNKVEVAVKMLHPDNINPAQKGSFKTEAMVMHQLEHRNVVSLLGICTVPDKKPTYIITELMHKGSLKDYLHTEEGKDLKELYLYDILLQIAQGMIYISSKNLVHHDLRAQNILVNRSRDVKIADFGLTKYATTANQDEQQNRGKFPVKWTAPECRESIFTEKSDVWSFAVVVFEVMTHGRTPYPDYKKEKLNDLQDDIRNGYRMPKPIECCDQVYEFMINCWNLNPDERPSFHDARTFFKALTDDTDFDYLDADTDSLTQ